MEALVFILIVCTLLNGILYILSTYYSHQLLDAEMKLCDNVEKCVAQAQRMMEYHESIEQVNRDIQIAREEFIALQQSALDKSRSSSNQ